MPSAQLTTSDGRRLDADLALSPADVPPRGAVVLCHPHPQYGGNRFDPVVTALFDHLPAAGFTALRFDFRSDFGGGVGERLDVVAALDRLDAVEELAGLPRFVVGYSFGASVALTTADPRIVAVAAVAPPLAMMEVGTPSIPTLVLTPRHDQFSPPDATASAVADWPDHELDVVESADHFLAGHTDAVADRVAAWLLDRSSPPGGTT